jgi:hypothetical protein
MLEGLQLPEVSGKWFQVRFRTNFMGRTLQKHRHIVMQELPAWALRVLPELVPRDHFEYPLNIPISLPTGQTVSIEVGVEVWDNMETQRPIHVSGILPEGNRLEPEVRRALYDKLPKLAEAKADIRILMIERPTRADGDNGVLAAILNVSNDFPLLAKIQGIVFANTSLLGEKVVFFSIWDVKAAQWSEYIKATIAE